MVIARGTVRREAHIILARPQYFDGSVRGFRHERRFDGIVMFQASAKASANQRDIYFDLIGIKADGLSHRIANILRNLCWRPQLTTRSAKLRGAVPRLERSVRHEGKLIRRFDVPAVSFRHISRGIK